MGQTTNNATAVNHTIYAIDLLDIDKKCVNAQRTYSVKPLSIVPETCIFPDLLIKRFPWSLHKYIKQHCFFSNYSFIA